MSSLKQIAKESGVCVETVSRVLNGKYKGRTDKSRLTMKKVMETATKLNYRPNNAARAMRTRETGLIGVVINEEGLRTHPVFSEVLKGANQVLKENGYILTISSLTGLEQDTLESRIFKEHLLDGTIIMDNSNESSVQEMLQVIPDSIMINCNTFLPHCCIRRDEFFTGWLAGYELKKLGYKKLIYFELDHHKGIYPHYSFKARFKGLNEALGENTDTLETVYSANSSQIFDWLNENKDRLSEDTVLITGSNLHLYAMMSAISRTNLIAGDDFGLVSLDDESGLKASFPALTRISFPREKIGNLAGKMLIDLLKGNKEKCVSLEIKGAWINGQTTRKVN